MLVVAAWSLRRPGAQPRREEIGHVTVRVEVDEPMTVAMLARPTTARSASPGSSTPTPRTRPSCRAGTETIGHNDLVTVVGPRAALDEVAERLGHVSSHDIVEDRHDLDFRRITLSNKPLVGHTVGELDLDDKFGATVSRVRRGDVDLVAHDTFVLAMGDRLRVIAPRDRMAEVGEYLGDSDRGMSDINVGGLALGLAVGMAIGLVHVPTPGGGFTIGAAAGTLLVGLVFGRLGRVGPVITSMSNGAAHAISALGMVTFLAYAGVRAGRSISEALASDAGWRVAGARAGAHRRQRRPARARACTSCAGCRGSRPRVPSPVRQTQPAILAYVNDRTSYDTRIGVAYALVYPVAMIAKIIVAQVLAGPLTDRPASHAGRPGAPVQSGRGLVVVDVEPVGPRLLLALVEDAADEPRHEVERGQRRREDEHRERVGGRRGDGREHEDQHDGDPPALDQPAGRHHADGVEPDEDHGEQEPDAEDEDEAGDEREVHRRLLDVRRARRAEAVQDLQRLRQDRVAEEAAEQEQRDRRAEERQRDPLLLAGQPRHDEGPELVEPDRAGDHDARRRSTG